MTAVTTTTPDFTKLTIMARCADAAYIEDLGEAKEAFNDLGFEVLGQYKNNSHQAYMCLKDGGEYWLFVSGSRVSGGTIREKLGDVIRDVDVKEKDLGEGVVVPEGAFEVQGLFVWAMTYLPAGTKLNGAGHSLGAWTLHYIPTWYRKDRWGEFFGFEPPKAGNLEFYQKYQDFFTENFATVINGGDCWAAWPWFSETYLHSPFGFIWLKAGTWTIISDVEWPGGMQEKDHWIENVIGKLEALA